MAAFHNSRPVSSEKSEENSASPVDSPRSLALKLAADLARQVGMVRTWPNLQTIRLAIESEAEGSGVSLDEAAEVITKAAQEQTLQRGPDFHSSWEIREIYRRNSINRFWFEDSLWRDKLVYIRFRLHLPGNEPQAEMKTIFCSTCNDMGILLNPRAQHTREHTIPCPDCPRGINVAEKRAPREASA